MITEFQYVGHFRDKALIEKLKAELSKHGILHEIRTAEEVADKYYLFVDAAHFKAGESIYQTLLGIGVPTAPNEADEQWMKISNLPVGPVGTFSVILSIALFIFYRIPSTQSLVEQLFIGSSGSGLFEEAIFHGQIWRLITPIFLHFSFFHILFNAMWMRELSKILEDHYSRRYFLFLFLSLGLGSNLAQYYLKGPMFGGLSGVVYGLLGVLWAKRSLDPDFPFMLPKRDLYLMIGWFLLCLTGLLGNIANTAHGIGLAIGVLITLFEVRKKVTSAKVWMKWLSYVAGIIFLTVLAEVAWSVINKSPLYFKQFG